MLAVIGVFIFLAVSLLVCGIIIGFVVNTIFSVVSPIVTLLGLALGFGSMVGKLVSSLISFFVKFIFAIIIFCACVLPYVGRAWHNLYRAFPDIVNNIGWHIDNLRHVLEEAINEGVNQHSQWLIYLWGLILVPVYYISNQIQNAARNDGNNGVRNEDYAGDEYRDMGDGNDPPPYEEDQNGGPNVRNRVRPTAPPMPQGPGLYPDLHNMRYNGFDHGEANNNDNDIGNVYLNNNDMNRNQMDDNDERLCVICFNRERNVAVFPCGHTWLCEPCTNNVMQRNRLCPVCQTRISEYRTVYI
ncbi:hypothetical protein ACF0H5_021392 [Mactra antiquata]